MSFSKDLGPRGERTRYNQALGLLQATDRVQIGHIDCGVAAHEALGYAGTRPPDNLHIHRGRDLLASTPDAPPVTDLQKGANFLDKATDFPDHGIKTLSCILSNTGELKGVAPGAIVVPMRIADGPVFQTVDQRDAMGDAMAHLMELDPTPRVITVSMGNPGNVGLLQPFFSGLGQSPGFNEATREQFDEAYERGIIVVCAAGQVIDRVVYPARYARTIAVGGFHRDRVTHYPPDDYDVPARVDIWAQAAGINRAFAERRNNGTVETGYAEDEGAAPTDISGTSYATPQVAAAAALWVNTWFNDLPSSSDNDAWKTVEAFRNAVRSSAERLGLHVDRPKRRIVTRPCLNIEALLGTAPDLAAVDVKAPRAKFWRNQL